ncbi:hypothetical protein HOE91_00880 [archaeon]|jgi:hypothetical protein|nr:hypothetical protein [archaeon]MBT4441388.1 hypothetical protein [archaeon]
MFKPRNAMKLTPSPDIYLQFADPILEPDYIQLGGTVYAEATTELSSRGGPWVESTDTVPVDVSFDVVFYSSGEMEFMPYDEGNNGLSFMGDMAWWRGESFKKDAWTQAQQSLVDIPSILRVARLRLIDQFRALESLTEDQEELLTRLELTPPLTSRAIEYIVEGVPEAPTYVPIVKKEKNRGNVVPFTSLKR